MNGECLNHLLTEEERNHFEKQGCLIRSERAIIRYGGAPDRCRR